MYAYCLACQTQRCAKIATLLEERGVHRAFSPRIIQRHRKQGKMEEHAYDLLPGYVFVFSEEKWQDFRILDGVEGVWRRLRGIDGAYELENGDYDFAMRLYEKDGVVGVMKAFHVGDEVMLEDPLFAGCKGKVTAVDYRKQRARVDFTFEAMECHTWIACDFIKSSQESSKNNMMETML